MIGTDKTGWIVSEPENPVDNTDIGLRVDRVCNLHRMVIDLSLRVEVVANNLYGSNPVSDEVADGIATSTGSICRLDFQLDLLENAIRKAHDQIGRLSNL